MNSGSKYSLGRQPPRGSKSLILVHNSQGALRLHFFEKRAEEGPSCSRREMGDRLAGMSSLDVHEYLAF